MDERKKNEMRTIGCDLAEDERYLRPETCKVEDRFAPTFYYVPNALKSLPTFRDESSPASRGNRIFSTAFSFASLLRGRAREKEEERGITSVPCDRSFVTTFLVACFRLPNNLFFVHDARLL